MIFKSEREEDQLSEAPRKLIEVCYYFDALSSSYGKEAICTRVRDAVCGDSGVHEAGRAADFRSETRDNNGSHFRYSDFEISTIVEKINSRYPREDGKLVCIYHSFQGMPYHFHIQIPLKWV